LPDTHSLPAGEDGAAGREAVYAAQAKAIFCDRSVIDAGGRSWLGKGTEPAEELPSDLAAYQLDHLHYISDGYICSWEEERQAYVIGGGPVKREMAPPDALGELVARYWMRSKNYDEGFSIVDEPWNVLDGWEVLLSHALTTDAAIVPGKKAVVVSANSFSLPFELGLARRAIRDHRAGRKPQVGAPIKLEDGWTAIPVPTLGGPVTAVDEATKTVRVVDAGSVFLNRSTAMVFAIEGIRRREHEREIDKSQSRWYRQKDESARKHATAREAKRRALGVPEPTRPPATAGYVAEVLDCRLNLLKDVAKFLDEVPGHESDAAEFHAKLDELRALQGRLAVEKVVQPAAAPAQKEAA